MFSSSRLSENHIRVVPSGGEKSEFWSHKNTWKITEINNKTKVSWVWCQSCADHPASWPTQLCNSKKTCSPKKFGILFIIWVTPHSRQTSFTAPNNLWIWHKKNQGIKSPLYSRKVSHRKKSYAWKNCIFFGEVFTNSKKTNLSNSSTAVENSKKNLQTSTARRLGFQKSSCCLTSVVTAGAARGTSATPSRVTQWTLPCPRISVRALGHHSKQRMT